jgi:hypothetical protein
LLLFKGFSAVQQDKSVEFKARNPLRNDEGEALAFVVARLTSAGLNFDWKWGLATFGRGVQHVFQAGL